MRLPFVCNVMIAENYSAICKEHKHNNCPKSTKTINISEMLLHSNFSAVYPMSIYFADVPVFCAHHIGSGKLLVLYPAGIAL